MDAHAQLPGDGCGPAREGIYRRAEGPPLPASSAVTPRLRLPPPPSLCVVSWCRVWNGLETKGPPRGCSFQRGDLWWAGWREQLSPDPSSSLAAPEAAHVLATLRRLWAPWCAPAGLHILRLPVPPFPPHPLDLGLSEKPGQSEGLPRRRAPAVPPSSCLGAALGRSLACGLHIRAFVSLGLCCRCPACPFESQVLRLTRLPGRHRDPALWPQMRRVGEGALTRLQCLFHARSARGLQPPRVCSVSASGIHPPAEQDSPLQN